MICCFGKAIDQHWDKAVIVNDERPLLGTDGPDVTTNYYLDVVAADELFLELCGRRGGGGPDRPSNAPMHIPDQRRDVGDWHAVVSGMSLMPIIAFHRIGRIARHLTSPWRNP